MRIKVQIAILMVCLGLAGCWTRYKGTKYEKQIPLGGYITGGVIADVGIGIALDEATSDWGTDGRIVVAGLITAGVGLAVILISGIGQAIANADVEDAPSVQSPDSPAGETREVPPAGRTTFDEREGLPVEEVGPDGPERLPDEKTEVEKLKVECDNGSSGACYRVGKAYRNGNGVSRSPAMARHYFRRACLQGHQPACGMMKL